MSRPRAPSGRDAHRNGVPGEPREATEADGPDRTVGVVGAGITGLALVHYLTERGVDAVAFEADAEPGGVIRSRTIEGRVLECGPQRMRKTPGVAELAEAAGVATRILPADEERLYVYADGELGRAPLSVSEFVRTDLLSWRGKARLALEPLTRPGQPQESAGELFVRKFGREAYERFIGPLYGGIYAADPAEMPAAFALEGLLEREREAGSLLQAFRQRVGSGHEAPPITFVGGNQRLPRALYERYADRIALETPVTDVSRTDGQGDGYRLSTPTGETTVERVVVTTPSPTAADLLAGVAPEAAGRLAELRYNPLAVVFLAADHDRPGKGYQVGYGEDLHTLGVSWNGQMFGRDDVQTAFLGGMFDPELVGESADRLGGIAAAEFERVMGVEATALGVERVEPGYPAWDGSWWAIEDLETPPGIALATNYTARMGVPSRVREARALAERLAADEPTDGVRVPA